MSDQQSLYPFEFFVEGTPVSLQASSRSKQRRRGEVQSVARQRISETTDFHYLENHPLALTIYYFPNAPMPGDIDNIVKPIVDALNGIAYLDDRIIERITVQKFGPAVNWQFTEPSTQLGLVLKLVTPAEREPWVYVRVDDDLSWRTI